MTEGYSAHFVPVTTAVLTRVRAWWSWLRRANRAYGLFVIAVVLWLLKPMPMAVLMLLGGAAAIGAGLWAWLGWPAAAVFWGVVAMAAGLEEVLDRG